MAETTNDKPAQPTDSDSDLRAYPNAGSHQGWRQLIQHFSLADLLWSQQHSQDFDGSRAEYIHTRTKIIAVVLAILTPLWIPIDFMILPQAQFEQLLGLRILLSAGLAVLGLLPCRRYRLWTALTRLSILVILASLFYLLSHLSLANGTGHNALTGYAFLPFLIIALYAIYPLTFTEVALLGAIIFATYIGAEWAQGTLQTLQALQDLWLMALLFSIALWAALAQLHMLLNLHRQATRDTLTGLFNRRALLQRLQNEAYRADRYERGLTVLMFDLDRFKRINDSYGHLTGDAVLKVFSDTLQRELRDSDLVGRYGGEEFLALMPETGAQDAQEVAERIRAACQNATACGPKNCVVGFTVSIGVANLQAGEAMDSLLYRADSALYEAKSSGRNCVILAPARYETSA